jgi:hypothetical protein
MTRQKPDLCIEIAAAAATALVAPHAQPRLLEISASVTDRQSPVLFVYVDQKIHGKEAVR